MAVDLLGWSHETPEEHPVTARQVSNLKLDAATEARLRRLAGARGKPAQGLMREAIDQYLEREESRERVLLDAQAAWDEFQATGLHVTAEEADAWLERLESGEDREPPQPHR
jgi:predicted transcriptional regulator